MKVAKSVLSDKAFTLTSAYVKDTWGYDWNDDGSKKDEELSDTDWYFRKMNQWVEKYKKSKNELCIDMISSFENNVDDELLAVKPEDDAASEIIGEYAPGAYKSDIVAELERAKSA